MRNGEDLCGNALFGSELLDAVGQRNEIFIVGGNDHVFATCLTVFVVFAETFAIVHLGQHITVEDDVLQDLVPFRGAVAEVTIGAVTAFYVKLQLYVTVNDELFGHWIVLERHHTHLHHLHTAYGVDLRNLKRLLRIKSIAPIDIHVFLVNRNGVVVIELRHSRRDEVDIADDLGLG